MELHDKYDGEQVASTCDRTCNVHVSQGSGHADSYVYNFTYVLRANFHLKRMSHYFLKLFPFGIAFIYGSRHPYES